jgi:hypothetical protein
MTTSSPPIPLIRSGVVRAYNAATHRADVQLDTSLGTFLPAVPVLSTVAPAEMRPGRRCVLVFLDPANPNDALVAGVYGDVPPDLAGVAGWPLVQTVVTPYNFVAGTAAAMTAANDAIWVPFVLPKRLTVSRVRIGEVAVSSGNIDVGIYDAAGTAPNARLVSSGSVACPAAGAQKDVTVAATAIGPGLYFLALAANNTTAQFRRYFDIGVAGVYRGTGQFPLPATASVNGGFPGDRWFGLGCY